MKKLFCLIFYAGLIVYCSIGNLQLRAQCVDTVFVGRSSNALTQVANQTKPVAADKNLNVMVFTHRIDSAGSSSVNGMFRYAISTDNGYSFTTIKPVLNPISSSWGRYPNAMIYNPAGNTNPNNAYLGYLGSTFAGSGFNGIVTGASPLSSGISTENYNQPGAAGYPAAFPAIRGSGGTFWALGFGNLNGPTTNSLYIYKGVWNGSNDLAWTTNTIITVPINTNTPGQPLGDCHIAFDPSGNIGWVSVLASLAGSPGNNRIYPVFFNTTNGGNSWTGPILFDQNQYSCITSNMSGSSVPCTDKQSGLTVDLNGNPHLLVSIGNLETNFNLNYNQWHNLFDITRVHGIWTAYDVATLKGSPAELDGYVYQKASPQVSRSADGSKVFFGWSDNAGYAMGAPNVKPDFFARAFDVQQLKWTHPKDFTSCKTGVAGKIFFNHLASEVLESAANLYYLSPVCCIMTASVSVSVPAKLYFLRDAFFNASDFSITQPEYTVSVNPGLNAAVCPGGTLNLQVINSPDQVLWSNGSTNPVRPVTNTGNYFVAARSGCTVGAATISVSNLTLNVAGTTSNVCVDDQMTLEIPGNAGSYTWNPGSLVGNPVTVTLTSNTLFNIVGEAAGGCTLSTTMQVNVNTCVGLKAGSLLSSLTIYPVPSKGVITLHGDQEMQLVLYDETGQKIRTVYLNHGNQFQTTLNELAKGLYVLRGQAENGEIFKKLLIE